jgi:polyisoprenoid-binding protein YceI
MTNQNQLILSLTNSTTMKKYFFLALLCTFTMSSAFKKSAYLFRLDPSKSTLKWIGNKNTDAWGYVKFSEGELMVENNVLRGGTLEMDVNTIDSQDGNETLVNHLKSDNFFSAENFPSAILVIKKVLYKGGNQYDIKADLTIKGITNDVYFPAIVDISGNEMWVTGKFNVNWSKYVNNYRAQQVSNTSIDKSIYDNFEVDVNISASLDYSKVTSRRVSVSRNTREK